MVEGQDILVVGGGIVGLASAIAMASRGFLVTVLDAGVLEASAIVKNTRVYAINMTSQRLFEQLGVWHLLPEIAFSPYQGMHIWDASNQAEMNFSARDVARAELGFILEEHMLKAALLKRASAMDITLVSGASVSDATETQKGFFVRSEDGRTWEAALCMIADGARSTVRHLLKVPVTSWSYHHDALVATVHTEKPHQKIAYQVFSADGSLAFLPLNDPHQCSIVWSHPPEHITALMTIENDAFEAQLTKAFAEKLGQVKLLSERITFPLKMRHVEQYAGASWMLLGDAAHTIHPLAGLGLNVGLADLRAWLCLLDAQKAKTVSVRILGAYQRERKYAVWSVIALMQGIKSFFGISAAPISTFRGFGMRVLNQMRPLKRVLMAYAAGETMR